VIREPADEQDMGRSSYRISRVNRVRACNSVGAVVAVTVEGEGEEVINERD
jgi:hypothetical protein